MGVLFVMIGKREWSVGSDGLPAMPMLLSYEKRMVAYLNALSALAWSRQDWDCWSLTHRKVNQYLWRVEERARMQLEAQNGKRES